MEKNGLPGLEKNKGIIMKKYYKEELHKGYAQEIQIKKELVNINSEFQNIKIIDTYSHGKVLILDNVVQVTEKDEAGYSEMLAHIPIFSLSNPKNILIIGGGDGAVAEEVLKHKNILSVDLVDIDGKVIELCKKYFSIINNNAFEDSRMNIYEEDAFLYLKNSTKKYDVIIADRPDSIGAAKTLYKEKFYKNISNMLTKNGITLFQSGVPFFQKNETKKTLLSCKKYFAYNGIILTVVPSYVGGYMALIWSSKKTDISKVTKKTIANIKKSNIKTTYYNLDMHISCFNLPNFIKDIIN